MASSRSANKAVTTQLEHALHAAGFGDAEAVEFQIDDLGGLAAFDLDPHEHERRRAAGLEAITSWDVLDAALSLPLNEPVETTDDVMDLFQTVAAAGDATFSIKDGRVMRALKPPLHVRCVAVHRAGWRPALTAASKFGLLCQRLAVCERTPREPQLAVLEATWLGVGLVLNGEIVTPPGAHPRLPGLYPWRFAEAVYAAYLATCRPSPGAGSRP